MGPQTTVTAGPIQPLTYQVLDAEYSQSLDRVVLVSAGPDQLHLYDPITHTEGSVGLPHVPTCVSVGPAGTEAVVGHDGWISHVDLVSQTLLNTFSVTADVLDVVLAGNGYAYAFPRVGQWEEIRCILLTTGLETLSSGLPIFAGTLAKPHPDGVSIYGADNGLYPADIEKYDISFGTANRLYDSPYHGDYPNGGDLWISEDGQRIFTKRATTFRALPVRKEDMRYNGDLDGLSLVGSLTDSAEIRKAVVLGEPGGGDPRNKDTEVQIYDQPTLGYERAVSLPLYNVGGTDYAAHGHFTFFYSNGGAFFVVVQADPAAGLSNDYAVVTFTVNTVAAAPTVSVGASSTPLPYHLLDAEFSPSLEQVISVSASPHQLHAYDPLSGAGQAVDLVHPPICVSVSPDGMEAVVGHDGWISHVALSPPSLLAAWPVTADVVDIVHGGNGYGYAFPRIDQWETIRCVQLSTGLETLSPSIIYAGTLAKLHPDGVSIYGANNGLSPADIEKYDISGGTAAYLYDSPYHGDYPMSGNLWIAKDGLSIFTRAATVFTSSPVQASDMTYVGALAGLSLIQWLDDSTTAGRIALVPEAPFFNPQDEDREVWYYDSATLAYQSRFSLPDFTFLAQTHVGRGRFVFFSADGTRLHAVIQADLESGLRDDFAVETYAVP